MARLGSSISRRVRKAFLDRADLNRIREAAEEIDAAYGALLDMLAPALLVALSERSRAA
jgi:hypothetical protein